MEMAYHQISSTPQVPHPSNALSSSPGTPAVSERHHTRWSAQAETKQSGLGDVGNCCQVEGGNEKNTYKNLGQFDVSNYWLIVDVKHVMMDVVDVFDVDSGDPW